MTIIFITIIDKKSAQHNKYEHKIGVRKKELVIIMQRKRYRIKQSYM